MWTWQANTSLAWRAPGPPCPPTTGPGWAACGTSPCPPTRLPGSIGLAPEPGVSASMTTGSPAPPPATGQRSRRTERITVTRRIPSAPSSSPSEGRSSKRSVENTPPSSTGQGAPAAVLSSSLSPLSSEAPEMKESVRKKRRR